MFKAKPKITGPCSRSRHTFHHVRVHVSNVRSPGTALTFLPTHREYVIRVQRTLWRISEAEKCREKRSFSRKSYCKNQKKVF